MTVQIGCLALAPHSSHASPDVNPWAGRLDHRQVDR